MLYLIKKKFHKLPNNCRKKQAKRHFFKNEKPKDVHNIYKVIPLPPNIIWAMFTHAAVTVKN